MCVSLEFIVHKYINVYIYRCIYNKSGGNKEIDGIFSSECMN